MAAGRLDRRLRFEERQEVSNGAGGFRGEWVHQFTVAAGRKWLRGGEAVIGARLEGRQPAILTIRSSLQARGIGHDWRAVDERDGRVFNLRESPKESDDRAYLEMLAESGVTI